jgi:hypothetical protein
VKQHVEKRDTCTGEGHPTQANLLAGRHANPQLSSSVYQNYILLLRLAETKTTYLSYLLYVDLTNCVITLHRAMKLMAHCLAHNKLP